MGFFWRVQPVAAATTINKRFIWPAPRAAAAAKTALALAPAGVEPRTAQALLAKGQSAGREGSITPGVHFYARATETADIKLLPAVDLLVS